MLIQGTEGEGEGSGENGERERQGKGEEGINNINKSFYTMLLQLHKTAVKIIKKTLNFV